MLTEAVDNDVFKLLKENTMALLPTSEVLERLYKLYIHNFNGNLPAQKRDWFLDVRLSNKTIYFLAHFLKVLPFAEYTYQILPPILPQSVALHIQGSVYLPPFGGLPTIRSKLHPCFVFHLARMYASKHRHTLEAVPLDESTLDRISDTSLASAGCVQKSWLGPPKTWADYPTRPLVTYLPDAPGTITPTSILLKKRDALTQANTTCSV